MDTKRYGSGRPSFYIPINIVSLQKWWYLIYIRNMKIVIETGKLVHLKYKNNAYHFVQF